MAATITADETQPGYASDLDASIAFYETLGLPLIVLRSGGDSHP